MKKNLKIVIISIILVVIGTGSFIGVKSYNTNQNYKKYLSQANTYVSKEQYDKAVQSYQEAFKCKNDANINKQIELAKVLKASKLTYDKAVKQMSDKQYLDAADTFKKVDKLDVKKYVDSQNKIIGCKKLYITDKFNIANDDLKNNKLDDANKVLADIFKVDAANADGLKLKDDIAKVLQKQKDIEAYKKKEQDLKKNGIASLGELRRKFGFNKYVILNVNDKSMPDLLNHSAPLSDEFLEKYGGYVFVSIGTGKWEDSDWKIAEPDITINGKLAYSVYSIDLGTYYGGGNGYDWDIRDVDGKVFDGNEVKDSIKNNKAFYKDGSILQLNGHFM
ncbi:hypothetical protein [Clostridium sp.]|uniref:hypothetical protein n=1 Tax=Clostridium sp. TaxID=1506 RepID=UPI003D6D3F9C